MCFWKWEWKNEKKKILRLDIIYMYRYKYNRMIKDDIIVRGGWVSHVGKVWWLFHILYMKNAAIFFKLILDMHQYNYSNTISTINYLNWWTLSKVMIISNFGWGMVVWYGMVVFVYIADGDYRARRSILATPKPLSLVAVN